MPMGMPISACRCTTLFNPGPVFGITCSKGYQIEWMVGGEAPWKALRNSMEAPMEEATDCETKGSANET